MFAKVAKQLAVHLEENQIIKSDDRELYVYGLNQGLSILLNIVTTLGIGLLFGTVLQLVVFMVAYIPLRSYAGGYHARTPVRCYLISIAMLTIISLLIKYITLGRWVYLIETAISSVIIAILSPVADNNKPLDEIEIVVYKKRTKRILLAEVVVSILSWITEWEFIFIIMTYVFLVMSFMLLIGACKNAHAKKYN